MILFNALVVPRLMYALQVAWLNKAERRKLDGFQNRCIRSLWGIKPSFVSRTSNAEVLKRTAQQPLSQHLEKQQLLYFGKVARADNTNISEAGSFRTELYVRRIGRLRAAWASSVHQLALRIAGSLANLEHTVAEEERWRRLVKEAYF